MAKYLLLLLALGGLLACSPTSTIYIVRHADRLNDSDTSSLSDSGLVRAERLALRLAQVRLDSVFVTPYQRTRQTAQPTADANGLRLTEYPASPATRITNRLRAFRRKKVLVVGHSNTILGIAKALGTTPVRQQIDHGDYGNLLVVKMKRTKVSWQATLREERY